MSSDTAGQTALIHGAAGNVDAYAVQLARQAGLHVVATVASHSIDYVRRLGAERIIDYQTARFEESLTGVDVVLDTVGGDTQQRSLRVLKPGGILETNVGTVLPLEDARVAHEMLADRRHRSTGQRLRVSEPSKIGVKRQTPARRLFTGWSTLSPSPDPEVL